MIVEAHKFYPLAVGETRTEVRVVVAGDRNTGKSSMISACMRSYNDTGFERLKDAPPSVMPPQTIAEIQLPTYMPLTMIDTSSSVKDLDRVNEELRQADSIVLTFACDQLDTFANIWLHWVPRIRTLGVKAPISIVGSKLDLIEDEKEFEGQLLEVFDAVARRVYKQKFEMPMCCEPTKSLKNIRTIFYNAQVAVLFPLPPLLDMSKNCLTSRCSWVLRKIFDIFDGDKDGVITFKELNNLEVEWFYAPSLPSDIAKLKEYIPNALEQGISFEEFLHMYQNHIIPNHIEAAWSLLRRFGYNDQLKLACNIIAPIIHTLEQSVELSESGIAFLERIFKAFDIDGDGMLQHSELDALLSQLPESPWIGSRCKKTVSETFQGLSLDTFLSQWVLATLISPTSSVENLVQLGYNDSRSAVHVTRKRHIDHRNQHSERNVFQCFIFGPRKAGKSIILNHLIAREFSEVYNPTDLDQYAVNVVDGYTGDRKYLVLKEIARDGVTKLLANKESLAACDVAIFVHDRSDKTSWEDSYMILEDFVRHGENGGFKVPCLIVSASNDTESRVLVPDDSYKVCEDLGMAYPIRISLKSVDDIKSLFSQIVTAAEFPHLPKSAKRAARKLLYRSLLCVTVGVVAVICAYVAYSEFVALPRSASPNSDTLHLDDVDKLT